MALRLNLTRLRVTGGLGHATRNALIRPPIERANVPMSLRRRHGLVADGEIIFWSSETTRTTVR